VRRIVRKNGNSCDGVGHVDDIEYEKIRRAAWKVDVLNRLFRVEEDVKRAISVVGWTWNEDAGILKICMPGHGMPGATNQDGASIRLMKEAQDVVETTYKYIRETKETLKPPKWQRFR
jgi:hypothetical protein